MEKRFCSSVLLTVCDSVCSDCGFYQSEEQVDNSNHHLTDLSLRLSQSLSARFSVIIIGLIANLY